MSICHPRQETGMSRTKDPSSKAKSLLFCKLSSVVKKVFFNKPVIYSFNFFFFSYVTFKKTVKCLYLGSTGLATVIYSQLHILTVSSSPVQLMQKNNPKTKDRMGHWKKLTLPKQSVHRTMTYWEFSDQWTWTGGIIIFWQPVYCSGFVHKNQCPQAFEIYGREN